MTRSTIQRLEVWRGDRKRTSGGLRKSDLTKNARGKIVSKKKSEQASKQNNLGDKLRKKGVHVAKDQMLHPKGKKAAAKPKPKKVQPKAKPKPKQPKKVQPKAKPKPKVQPKKVAPKKVVPLASRTNLPTARKVKKGYNPITNQPYGPRGEGKVTLDNVMSGTRASREAAAMRAHIAAQKAEDAKYDDDNMVF